MWLIILVLCGWGLLILLICAALAASDIDRPDRRMKGDEEVVDDICPCCGEIGELCHCTGLEDYYRKEREADKRRFVK